MRAALTSQRPRGGKRGGGGLAKRRLALSRAVQEPSRLPAARTRPRDEVEVGDGVREGRAVPLVRACGASALGADRRGSRERRARCCARHAGKQRAPRGCEQRAPRGCEPARSARLVRLRRRAPRVPLRGRFARLAAARSNGGDGGVWEVERASEREKRRAGADLGSQADAAATSAKRGPDTAAALFTRTHFAARSLGQH